MEDGRHRDFLAALDVPPALSPGPDVVAPFEPVFYEARSVRATVVEPPVVAGPVAMPGDDVVPEEPAPPSDLPTQSRPARTSWRDRTIRLRAPWLAAVIATTLVVGVLIGRAITGSGPQQSVDRLSAGAPAAPEAPNASAASSVPAPAGGPPGAANEPRSSAAPGAVAAPTTALPLGSPKLLLDIRRHDGPMTTEHFTLPGGRWVLGWAYDCSASGGQGDFQITIYKPDGLPGTEGGVNQRGVKGSSVAAFTTTGERYLGVQTDCVWAIRVTA